MEETILSIKNIKKTFGNTTAISDFNLDIKRGEFITILGPSGCGKTTLLRIIAGLETPDSGQIFLDDINISELPPEKRNVNTVFQNFALFPHMNVFENIAYGLKLKKFKKDEIKTLVSDALELVKLTGYENRRITQLSGGQKQRVAIARAIVLKPEVLLLDEPLGALDYKLRLSMQTELKKIQMTLNTTFVYITHDQDEALNLSDRIVLMSNATIEQIATPDEIYKTPKTLFAAKFIGEPNILKGLHIGDNQYDFSVLIQNFNLSENEEVFAVIRPESLKISDDGINATVIDQSVKGGVVITNVILKNGTVLRMHSFDTKPYAVGDNINILCSNKDVHYIVDKSKDI
ncbi:MAG: ABC transporter ATP-binding protein [Clostridia bacterium]|nr:ABC transporter ATP-binding protein [Clostridia bacterium]